MLLCCASSSLGRARTGEFSSFLFLGLCRAPSVLLLRSAQKSFDLSLSAAQLWRDRWASLHFVVSLGAALAEFRAEAVMESRELQKRTRRRLAVDHGRVQKRAKPARWGTYRLRDNGRQASGPLWSPRLRLPPRSLRVATPFHALRTPETGIVRFICSIFIGWGQIVIPFGSLVSSCTRYLLGSFWNPALFSFRPHDF